MRDIFTGKIKNWQEVGGPNLKITPLSRNSKAGGTVEFFINEVLDKQASGASVKEVRNTTESIRGGAKVPGEIGYATIYMNSIVL